MDESTYVGPTAAAKLAALAKSELGKKAGKDVATAEAGGLMSATDKVKPRPSWTTSCRTHPPTPCRTRWS